MASTPRRPRPGRIPTILTTLHRDERGQAMTEYVVILCGISLVAITVIGEIADRLVELLSEAFEGMDVVTTNLE